MNEKDKTTIGNAWRSVTEVLVKAKWIQWESPQALCEAARNSVEGHESQQAEKTLNRYNYDQGPMYFLAQQIVRGMQDAGYPCKIVEFWRSPERQAELLAKKPAVTKAGPWQSAHQYYCAADLVHPAKGWGVTEIYWETLASVVRNVAEKFDVELDHGHYWRFRDSAHVQLEGWRGYKALIGERRPDSDDLVKLWEATLPEVWWRYMERQLEKVKTGEDGHNMPM